MEPNIRTFDSLDQMFSELNEARRQADDAMHEVQRGIQLGSWVVAVERSITIFGHVFDRATFIASEIAAGGSQAEAENSWEQYGQGNDNTMLFGQWFSIVEPDGEFGSQHRLRLWPISQQCFELARVYEWAVSAMPGPAYREMLNAITALEAHQREKGYIR